MLQLSVSTQASSCRVLGLVQFRARVREPTPQVVEQLVQDVHSPFTIMHARHY